MQKELQELRQQALDELSTTDTSALQGWQDRYLHKKKGALAPFFGKLRDLAAQDRAAAGAAINQVAQELKAAAEAKFQATESTVTSSWQGDPTAQVYPAVAGSLHPLTLVRRRIERIFAGLGFDTATGPHIETEYYNFSALNIPDHHPAREMQDTFYVDLPPSEEQVRGETAGRYLLRTHTSPVQIHYMHNHEPPIRMIAPGRVYRCDADVTHSPMFQQIEGLWIEEGVTLGHLKGVLRLFLSRLFRKELAIRLRPSYFPFTEPSAEVDMECVFCSGQGCRICSDSGWIEVLGSGMVHPNVLRNGGLDPDKYQGLAFGVGVERLTMLYYGINDIRHFTRGALPFLRQFSGEKP